MDAENVVITLLDNAIKNPLQFWMLAQLDTGEKEAAKIILRMIREIAQDIKDATPANSRPRPAIPMPQSVPHGRAARARKARAL